MSSGVRRIEPTLLAFLAERQPAVPSWQRRVLEAVDFGDREPTVAVYAQMTAALDLLPDIKRTRLAGRAKP